MAAAAQPTSAKRYYYIFQLAMFKAVMRYLGQIQENQPKAELEETIRNQFLQILFGLGDSESVPASQSPLEHLYGILWGGFTEITGSFQVLQDIPVYLQCFPSDSDRAFQIRYLQYHIANYLNEVYILKLRLRDFAKKISRKYRKDERLKTLQTQIDFSSELLSSFDGIVRVRGDHVHKSRFTDESLDRLGMLERLSSYDDPELSQVFELSAEVYGTELQRTRESWIGTMTRNNETILEIVDAYFGILYEVVFDERGEVIVPFKVKA